jgi:hypothetical protein
MVRRQFKYPIDNSIRLPHIINYIPSFSSSQAWCVFFAVDVYSGSIEFLLLVAVPLLIIGESRTVSLFLCCCRSN